MISVKDFWSLLLFFFSSVGVDVSAGRFTNYFIYYLYIVSVRTEPEPKFVHGRATFHETHMKS